MDGIGLFGFGTCGEADDWIRSGVRRDAGFGLPYPIRLGDKSAGCRLRSGALR
jgi:hypothetical protein